MLYKVRTENSLKFEIHRWHLQFCNRNTTAVTKGLPQQNENLMLCLNVFF